MPYGPRQHQVKNLAPTAPRHEDCWRTPSGRCDSHSRQARWGAAKSRFPSVGKNDRARDMMFTLDDLVKTIADRAEARPETSYTRSLLDRGAAHCARKFGEEAIELAIAAAALDEDAVRSEAADVLYHLLVVLRARGVALSSVISELEGRTQRSGHEEKTS